MPFYKQLYKLAIFLIPFSGVAGLTFLGEYAMEAAFYVFFLAFVFFVPRSVNRKLPTLILLLVAAFSLSVVLGLIANVDAIANSELKGRSGFNKFFSSMPVFYFGAVVALMTQRVGSDGKGIYEYIIKPSVAVLLFCTTISILEFGAWFNAFFYSAYDLSSQVLRAGRWPSFSPGRLQSVTFEPSVFGLYLGYMFVILNLAMAMKGGGSHGRKFRSVWVGVLMLMVVSNARTASVLLVGLLVSLIFVRVLTRLSGATQKLLVFLVMPIAVFLGGVAIVSLHDVVVTGIIEGESVSNLSRYASNVAAFNIFVDHPIFGSGLGQYAFNAINALPDWAWHSYEIDNWFTDPDFTWPPVYSLPLRIASELGLFGILSWYGFFSYLFYLLARRVAVNAMALGDAPIGKALLLGVMYIFLSGVSYDSFRNFGVWVILGIVCAYLARPNSEREFRF